MKVKRVSVTFSRKVHPRPFNPVETSMTIEANLSEDDNEKEVRIKLFNRLKKDIDAISMKILKDEGEEDD